MTTLIYDDGVNQSFGADMFPEMLDEIVQLAVRCGRQQQRAIEAETASRNPNRVMVNRLWAAYYKTLRQRRAAEEKLKKAVASHV